MLNELFTAVSVAIHWSNFTLVGDLVKQLQMCLCKLKFEAQSFKKRMVI